MALPFGFELITEIAGSESLKMLPMNFSADGGNSR